MADQTLVSDFKLFQWKSEVATYASTGATQVAHNVALPSGITGDYFVSFTTPAGLVTHAYVPASSATDTLLGDDAATATKLKFITATGFDITLTTGTPFDLPKSTKIVANVDHVLIRQLQDALNGLIGATLKFNSRPLYEGTGSGADRVFGSTGARDAALTSPAEGDKCRVTGLGAQTYDGSTWQTFGTTTTVISSWKEDVVAATTGDITLSGEQTIDGVTTSTSRVLVMSQTTTSENGIYVSDAGAWTRTADFDASSEVTGSVVVASGGTVNGNQLFICTTNDPTIGTDPIVFSRLETSPIASQSQAEAGTDNTNMMTPLRTKQAIDINKLISKTANETISGATTPAAVVAGFTEAAEASMQAYTGTGSSVVCYGVNWRGQKFTTPAGDGVLMTKVDITFVGRTGTPTGNFDISIYATSGGLPTGSALETVSATAFDQSNTTTSFVFTVGLSAGTTYAVVMNDSAGNASNHVNLSADSGGGTDGLTSSDSGATWATNGQDVVSEMFGKIITFDSNILNANAANAFRLETLGFVAANVSASASASIQREGILAGFTSLTRGSTYYLSDTDGLIQTTAGTNSVIIGRAISSTEILILLQP